MEKDMKVVYNNCFGGFGLSPIALTELAKKKGVSLFWYKQTGYQHEGNERYIKLESVPSSGGFDLFSCTKDLGEEIKAIDSDFHYYPDFYDNSTRCDTDLVDVVESLGDLASGKCADLKIKEIPDGSEFEIDYYDGNESVVPPRQSW